MASHLSVSSNSVPNLGAGKSSGPTEEALPGAFAAFLGSTEKKTSTPPAQRDTSVETTSTTADRKNLKDEREPEAVAAVVDAPLPSTIPEEAKPVLAGIVDDLATLQASLDAGQPVDPELLKRIDAALSEFADLLGIDLADVPSLDALRQLAAQPPADADFTALLANALQPLALSLQEGTVDAGAENAELVKSIGDKLAALLQALEGDYIAPETLAQLQPDGEAPVDEDLQAALARLTRTSVPEETTKLGTAELDVPETVLTGKTDSSAPAEKEAGEKPAESVQTKVGLKKDRPAPEPQANAGAADADAPDAQAGTQPVQTARADAIAPRVVQAGYQTSQQQLNLPQLAFEIVRQVGEGNTRFQIRFDPPELGRIDVKLDIDASGRVNARLTVEKAETLDLMQRDQRALERALQQAGLDGNKTNLEFSLRQNPFAGGQQGRDDEGRLSLFADEAADGAEEATPPLVNLYRGNLSASGVNIIA